MEGEDAFLLAWSDAVRFTADPRAVLAETTARLGRRLGATRVNYAEADEAGVALTVRDDWTDGAASVAGGVFPLAALGEAVIADHLRGRPFVTSDFDADPRAGPPQRALYASVGVRAAVTAPLVKDGRLLAVLSVQQARPREWTPAEVRLVQELAERTWAVLERARAEFELARSRERRHQGEKSAALDALLSGVGHELNNPLAIIAAQAALLQRASEGADTARRATLIADAADRCGRIVQTFLAIARQKDPAPAPVDLNAVAAGALELAAGELREAGVAVERRLAPGLPLLHADSGQLRQALLHLVANARQAMADGPGPRRLTLTTGLGDGGTTVWLEAADTGPGVAPEHRGRVFDPFFTTRPQGVGAGVGLSLAQGLVEGHGGALTLAPSEGGAVFRMVLPLAGSGPALAAPPAGARPTVPAPWRTAWVSGAPSDLTAMLAQEGFSCSPPPAGAERAEASPQLVVGVLAGSGPDGPALAERLTAQRPELLERLVFLVEEDAGAAAVRFLQRARRPFLHRPFSAADLREVLREVEAGAVRTAGAAGR